MSEFQRALCVAAWCALFAVLILFCVGGLLGLGAP